MTKKTYFAKILALAKKYRAINYLGGKCENCGEDRFFRLSFHHVDGEKKENTINILKYKSWIKMEKEVNKCKLLCKNCHHEFHSTEKETIYKNSKKIYLDFKNSSGCEKCGYNKCNDSLTFHHIEDKIMKICGCRTSNIDKIKQNIINELNKCIILCQNCHTEEHSDIQFFEEHLEEIILKSNNLKRKHSKIDRNVITSMYLNGINQKEIAKQFNCSKGTISGIIKELNINREYRVDEYEVEKLYNDGLSPVEISKKLGINSRSTIYAVIKRIKNKNMAPWTNW